ncbi:Hypothetical predicted protein [Mytilus galloprovincialis]|uniref:Uncharacterized protein n=1 Tax=Mytilus galloprovincialis TaxID=29158 RepID=A0A8B6BJQ6_MYTGA|nr:Hypothetical predicted protein [Mytilus galloprovincialis]
MESRGLSQDPAQDPPRLSRQLLEDDSVSLAPRSQEGNFLDDQGVGAGCPTSRSMGSDNFRQVGTFDFTEGWNFSFWNGLLFSCSNQSVSDKGFSKNQLLQDEVNILIQKGVLEELNPPFSSRVLIPGCSWSQENGENETGSRSFCSQSVSGVPHFKMETTGLSGRQFIRNLDNLSRFDGRLFSHPDFSQVSSFPETVWADKVYSSRLAFCLAIAPLVLPRIFQTVVSYLHTQAVLIHSYLDDSLIKNHCRSLFWRNTPICLSFYS